MVFRQELFCNIPVQPDFLGNADSFAHLHMDSGEIISELYEPLRKQHPDYITRNSIGFDTSGKFEMWMYDFKPEEYHATVYLQSGVHPIETEGVLGLARIMNMVVSGLLPGLERIRFIVVPVVSVFGANERAKAQNIVENYELKHNVLGINSNRDCIEKKLKETKNVLSVIENYKDVIDFGFDLHTTTETFPGWGDYMTVYPDNLPSAQLVVETNEFLRNKNITDRQPWVKYVGPDSSYPNIHILGTLDNCFSSYIFNTYNIPMCTLEHSDFSFDNKLGSSIAVTRAVEMYVNHIIQAKAFYIGK